MDRDRSLDEFIDGGDASADTGSDDAESETDPAAESGADSDTVGSNAEPESETRESAEGAVEPNAPVSDATAAGDRSAAEAANASAEDAAGAEPDSDERSGSDSTEPATATYRWLPDGVECPECGRVTEERWIHKGRHVCADCKEW